MRFPMWYREYTYGPLGKWWKHIPIFFYGTTFANSDITFNLKVSKKILLTQNTGIPSSFKILNNFSLHLIILVTIAYHTLCNSYHISFFNKNTLCQQSTRSYNFYNEFWKCHIKASMKSNRHNAKKITGQLIWNIFLNLVKIVN